MCVPLKVEENYNGGGITESLPQKPLGRSSLTPSPPQSLGGGCLRRPLKHSPYLLPPLERRRMVAHPQSHHTIVPVHPPSHLNQQQTKSLHPRRPLRPLQAQPLDRTDD